MKKLMLIALLGATVGSAWGAAGKDITIQRMGTSKIFVGDKLPDRFVQLDAIRKKESEETKRVGWANQLKSTISPEDRVYLLKIDSEKMARSSNLSAYPITLSLNNDFQKQGDYILVAPGTSIIKLEVNGKTMSPEKPVEIYPGNAYTYDGTLPYLTVRTPGSVAGGGVRLLEK